MKAGVAFYKKRSEIMTTLIRIQKRMTVVVAVCLMVGVRSALATNYTCLLYTSDAADE